jgi:hypothetical protein
MNPDENNERDWPLMVATIIIGVGLVAFVAYALFVVIHMRI